jgi:DNA replication protein DnaC
MTHGEFLAMLLEDEKLYRRNCVAKRLASRARFRTQAALEDWDTTFPRGISNAELQALAALGFQKDRANLLIYGKTGEGKTQLAVSVGRAACQNGLKVEFISTNQLFEDSEAARASGTYPQWKKRLIKLDLLILDDFASRPYEPSESALPLDILEERYQKSCNIITSQVLSGGWLDVFPDKVTGEAVIDRLKHPSLEIKLKGGSYRERLAAK